MDTPEVTLPAWVKPGQVEKLKELGLVPVDVSPTDLRLNVWINELFLDTFLELIDEQEWLCSK